MSFEPRDYLRHILVEADYLIGRSEGLSLEAFSAVVSRAQHELLNARIDEESRIGRIGLGIVRSRSWERITFRRAGRFSITGAAHRP